MVAHYARSIEGCHFRVVPVVCVGMVLAWPSQCRLKKPAITDSRSAAVQR